MFRLVCRYLDLGADGALSFTSTGWLKGVLAVVGPESPRLSVSADGSEKVFDLIDQGTNYERMSTVIFDESYPPATLVTMACDAGLTSRPGAAERRLKVIGLLLHDPPDAAVVVPVDRVTVAGR